MQTMRACSDVLLKIISDILDFNKVIFLLVLPTFPFPPLSLLVSSLVRMAYRQSHHAYITQSHPAYSYLTNNRRSAPY